MPYGKLHVTLVDGQDLKKVDFFGKNDPYCILLLQAGASVRQKWRSKTHQEGGKDPKWNETHVFLITEGDDRIQIQCYDEDNGSDDFIGSVTVHLNQVFAQGSRDEYFPLVTKASKPSGKVRLVIRFEPQGPQGATGSMYAPEPSLYAPGYGPPPSVYGPPSQYGPPQPTAYTPQSQYASPPPQGPASVYGQPAAGYAPAGFSPGQSMLPPRNSSVPSYGAPPAQGAYGAPPAQGAYGAPPAQGAYGAPPAQGAYGAPPAQGAYGAPPAQGAYRAAPTQGDASSYGQVPPGGGYTFGTPTAHPFDVASNVSATYSKYGMSIQ